MPSLFAFPASRYAFRYPTETFNAGDIVRVKGRLYSGVARVLETCYISPDNLPKGELSYSWKYGEPFPQLGITPMRPGAFEDRTVNIHYNGDDLVEPGKIQLATEDEKREWAAWEKKEQRRERRNAKRRKPAPCNCCLLPDECGCECKTCKEAKA